MEKIVFYVKGLSRRVEDVYRILNEVNESLNVMYNFRQQCIIFTFRTVRRQFPHRIVLDIQSNEFIWMYDAQGDAAFIRSFRQLLHYFKQRFPHPMEPITVTLACRRLERQ